MEAQNFQVCNFLLENNVNVNAVTFSGIKRERERGGGREEGGREGRGREREMVCKVLLFCLLA